MRKQYDFSKGIRNPYARSLKRQITIRIDNETIAYFQDQATRVGLPYQSLINLYLRDCMESRRKLKFA
ncbi:MAG: antitoxin [Elusimicrobia bacterium RBG_16_66_12]|nr:MAG: antitoxin [Elusimicrobia bacterium RBG_16_66_12]